MCHRLGAFIGSEDYKTLPEKGAFAEPYPAGPLYMEKLTKSADGRLTGSGLFGRHRQDEGIAAAIWSGHRTEVCRPGFGQRLPVRPYVADALVRRRQETLLQLQPPKSAFFDP